MEKIIDPSIGRPLHLQVEDYIRRLAAEECYQKGELLPKETDLAEQLHISRTTVRAAISKLVIEGLLVRKKGVGTRVVHQSIRGGVKNWLSFSQEMSKLGIQVKNYELHLSFKKPNSQVKSFFQIKDEDIRTLVMERLRGNQDYPFVYFVSYFNPELNLTGDEDFKMPLYEMLEKTYGIVVKTSKESVNAALAGPDISNKLGISRKDPILIRKRFVFDANQIPIEYNIGYYRADSFTYTIESER